MTLALAALAALYLRGWYRLRTVQPELIPAWRLAAFAGGIVLLWLAVEFPLAELDHHLLTAHMLQHLLLMIVVAPLILLGAPYVTLLHGVPQGFVRGALEPLMRWHPVHAVGAICSQPAFCWLAAAVTVIGWHVPAAFDLALLSHGWHEIEHACFSAAGLLFWRPVIRPWPRVGSATRWSIPLYLFLATLPCDALSAFLAFSDHVVYRHYLPAHGTFDLSPLQDQGLAGALMWVVVTFAYLIPAVAVTVQILSGPQRLAGETLIGARQRVIIESAGRPMDTY